MCWQGARSCWKEVRAREPEAAGPGPVKLSAATLLWVGLSADCSVSPAPCHSLGCFLIYEMGVVVK